MTEKPTYEALEKRIQELEKAESGRKRTEEALRQSYAMLARTERITNVGSWEWDIEADRVRWSDELFHIFQRDPARGAPSFAEHPDIYMAEDMDRLRVAVETCISKGTPYELEICAIRQDGIIRQCVARGQAECDEAGRISRLVGSLQDITERKRAEEALRTSERYLRSTLDGLSVHIVVLDDRGEIILTNKAYRDFGEQNGIEPGTVFEGANYLAVCDTASGEHSEEANPFAEGIREVLSGNRRSFELEYPCHSADEKRWFIGRVMPFTSEGPRRVVVAHENITLRKETEKVLRESEEKFSTAFRTSPYAITITRAKDGKFIEVNDAFITMTGFTREEANADSAIGLKLWMNTEVRDQVVNELLAGRTVLNHEYQFRTKGDKTFMGSFSARAILLGGEPCILSSIENITDRKQAESQRKKSHELLSNLARLVPGVIYQYRLYPDGRSEFPYSSPGMNHIYEVTPEEVREDATPVYGRLHPDDYDHVVDTIQESARTLQTFYCEFRVILPRKGLCWRWSQAHPERMPDGSILWHGIISDVTERKHAEEKLRVSHEKMLTILDSIDSTVYVVDMDTHEILFMNKKMITDFGGDKTGEKCFKAFRNESEPCSFCNNDRLVDADGRPVGVLTWHDQNKIIGKYYINHGRAIEWADGRLVRVQFATDITDMKNMEAQLIQTQKMESIGTLAGGIAHDFNNILFPIVGHTEMLLEDIPLESPFRSSLDQILSGSLRATALVQQILSFSRQEKSELAMMKMQPIIKEAMKLIRSTIPATISINQSLQSSCGPVKADPTQIHQIVMNLATNAYHAMEETGGELKISLREIELGQCDLISPDMSPGVYACLTVSDTGTGMGKDLIQRIFDPFFTTKEKGKGTGMGLSVVHGIVMSLNGSIQVNSEPGRGTEFNVYLPIVGNISEKQEPFTKEQLIGGSERILLVDDEEPIVSMEKQILERLGYHVTPCTDSLKALEVFRANPDQYDLVITDMAMPKMPGDKLAVELINIRPDIPILVCTGFSEKLTGKKAKLLGFKGILIKPIVKKNLAKKIREIFG